MKKKISVEIDLTIPPEYEDDWNGDDYVCADIHNFLNMAFADCIGEYKISVECKDIDEGN